MEKNRITPELIKKAEKAQTPEELIKLAVDEGIELTPEEAEKAFARLQERGELSDEELDNVAGGGCRVKAVCARCGSKKNFTNIWKEKYWVCKFCQYRNEIVD